MSKQQQPAEAETTARRRAFLDLERCATVALRYPPKDEEHPRDKEQRQTVTVAAPSAAM